MIECIDIPNLKAAAIENGTAHLATPSLEGIFFWTAGDYSGAPFDDLDKNVVKSNAVPLTSGAWVRQDARTLVFRQPQLGGMKRTIASKLESYVDLHDFLIDSDRIKVAAGVQFDASYAFQAAFDACSGKTLNSNQAGKKLHIPAGRYYINSSVTFTWRNTANVLDAGDRRKITIEGDGSANTVVFCDVGNGPAFKFLGFGNADGTNLDLSISGLSIIQSTLGENRVGTGLATNQIARLQLADVRSNYFNVGWDLSDAIYVDARHCEFAGNIVGAVGAVSAFSNPNVLTLASCSFGGNIENGVRFTQGANLNLVNCSFEGIGISNSPIDDLSCISLLNGPAEGGCQAIISDCYFENNNVYADIRAEWGSANGGTIIVMGCSFQRVAPTKYQKRHIVMSQVGVGKMLVSLIGNAFKSFGSYVPGNEVPWEVTTTNITVDDQNNLYLPNELPGLNGLPALRNCGQEIVAQAIINANGAPVSATNCTVSKTGLGLYRLTFLKPLRDTNAIVEGCLENSFGFLSSAGTTETETTIQTSDLNGIAADRKFRVNIVGQLAA